MSVQTLLVRYGRASIAQNLQQAIQQGLLSVNIVGLEFSTAVAPPNSDLDYLKSLGINYVRLPYKWQWLQPTLGGAFDEIYAGYIDTLLDHAASLGMKILLDVHNYGGRPEGKVGDSNGTVTSAHFADLWLRSAQRWKDHAGLWGYDLMNEWAQMENPSEVQVATQAAIDAIRTVDMTTTIFYEYYWWSSSWQINNYGFVPTDPADNIIISAHMYPDRDSSGSHFDWQEEVAAGDQLDGGAVLDENIGVKRLQPFVAWLQQNNMRGHIGEFGCSKLDAEWLEVFDRVLQYCLGNGLHFSYWSSGTAWNPDYEYLLHADSAGKQSKQFAVLTKRTGAAQPTDFWTSTAGNRGVSGQPLPITVEYRGYITSPLAATVQEITGNAGSFDATAINFANGFNGEQIVNFTPTQETVYQFNTTNAHGFDDNSSLVISTIPDAFTVSPEPNAVIDFYNEYSPYQGLAVRVKRDSDNAEADFGRTADGWVDRQAIVDWAGSPAEMLRLIHVYGKDGNRLERFNSYHTSQPWGSTDDPRYKPIFLLETDTDGRPALMTRYKSRMDLLTTDQYVSGKSVMIKATLTGNKFVLSDDAANYNFRLFNNNEASITYEGETDSCPITITLGENKVYGVSWKGATTAGMSTYVDGVVDSTIDTNITSFVASYHKQKMNMGYFAHFDDHLPAKSLIQCIYTWDSQVTGQQFADIKTKLDARPNPAAINYMETFNITNVGGPALPTGMLRGVGVSGAEGFNGNRFFGVPNYDYIADHNLDIITYFHDKGMNVIRLALEWNRLQPKIKGPLNQGDLAKINTVVQHCRSLGMMVILEPHNYNGRWMDDYKEYSWITDGIITPLDASVLADFWTRLATAYQNQDNVIFNLMNEPNGLAASVVKDVMLPSIAAIRAITTTHRIQIPGTGYTNAMNWCGSPSGNPTGANPTAGSNADVWNQVFAGGWTDPNYEFEMHQYLDGGNSGTSSVCTIGAGNFRLSTVTDWARLHGHKIFLGEVGWSQDSSCTQEGTDIINYTETNTDVWSGWAYWASYQWNPNHMFALNPSNINDPATDKPQMTLLEGYL